MSEQILLGGNGQNTVSVSTRTLNRHGLIAGATGTGKTVSLQVLAESLSRAGVPVFVTDVKGDLSGLSQAGKTSSGIKKRLATIGIEAYTNKAAPVVFWDISGERGQPIRATISDIGPLLLSSLLELNETQTGVLYSSFEIADDNGLLLLDLKDLRSMLNWVGDHAKSLSSQYGNITRASIGAIQRRLLVLREQGAEQFFGEPAVQLQDLMRRDFSGNGVINVLDVTATISRSPKLYATFLLWLLSELFEQMPEVGDPEKPELVLFFDEAHLLFDRAPRSLVDKVEQVVRLIRSKGIGVFFISQSPLDVPEDILGQLGLRVQHALRAFTPKDKRTVTAVADTFRQNPELETVTAITELGLGEALVSVLQEDGVPTPVERILIKPPESRIGPASAEERQQVRALSPVRGRYEQEIDRESAYELLKARAEQEARQTLAAQAEEKQQRAERVQTRSRGRRSNRQSVGEAMMKSVARSMGSSLGRRLVRGLLGSLLGGR